VRLSRSSILRTSATKRASQRTAAHSCLSRDKKSRELERMDREGDYQEPEGEASVGTIWFVSKAGRGRIIV
jgi:hypothetical protein